MSGQWSLLAKEGVAALSKGNGVPSYGDICRQEDQWHRQTRKVVRQIAVVETTAAVAAAMAAAGASTGVAADRMSPSGGDVGYDK
jgi:hypothetical protein